MATTLLTHTGTATQINYLLKARNDKLKLIEGGSETFNDALGLIDEYEGSCQIAYRPNYKLGILT
jgi:hypothetical protein